MGRSTLDEVIKYMVVIIIGLAIGFILIYIKGENPFTLTKDVLNYALRTKTGIFSTLRWASPIILSGLAVSIAFKVNIGNIGAEGQIYVGGLIAAILGYSIQGVGAILHKLILIIGSMIGGALFSLIPALLLVSYGVNEIVSTMMLNYVAIWGTEYIVKTLLMDTEAAVPRLIATREILPTASLGKLIPPHQLNSSFLLGIFLCIIFFLIYKYLTIGYELETLGKNKNFARYGGISVKQMVFLVFAISGAIGGLTGATEIMGTHYKFVNDFSAGIGWDGLLVALIAQNNPIGVIFAGLFWGFLKNCGFIVERISNVDRWTIKVVQASMVFLITAKIYFLPYLQKLVRRGVSKS